MVLSVQKSRRINKVCIPIVPSSQLSLLKRSQTFFKPNYTMGRIGGSRVELKIALPWRWGYFWLDWIFGFFIMFIFVLLNFEWNETFNTCNHLNHLKLWIFYSNRFVLDPLFNVFILFRQFKKYKEIVF